MKSKHTFTDFMRTDTSRHWCPNDQSFYNRLLAADIKSLDGLLRWTRERYPLHYKATSILDRDGCTGRGAMQRLWAKFLEWKES